jgi:integrase
MPRKKQRRANPGSGSVYWSRTQERYVGEITLGRDDRCVRVKKVIVGPRGDKSDEARLGLKDRLQQWQHKHPKPRAGKGRAITRTTLGEYLEDWLESKTRLSEAASATYAWAIDRYLEPQLGRTRLRDLNREQLRAFFSKLTLGDASKQKIQVVLRAALNDAVTKRELISSNPAIGLELEKTQGRSEVAVWNADQAKRFLGVAKDTENFALFLLMIVGALGPAEAFGIQWKDVDFNKRKVAIVRNLTEVGGRLIPKETKTKSRRRSVAIPNVVVQALRARYKSTQPAPNDYVFTAPEGGGIRRTHFSKRVWLPIIKRAKVPTITLYGLRHSSASLMAAMGIPLVVASRALGHSNIRTTADTYTHLFEETQREVADKFQDFLRGL